jgi:hypothetical protein
MALYRYDQALRPPSPREVEIPIDSLLPIQAEGVSSLQLEFIRRINKNSKPIEVVPYEDEQEDQDASHLVIDGLHRAYNNWWDGNKAIRAKKIETDAQVFGSLVLWVAKCSTLEEVRRQYEEVWLPSLREKSIRGVGSVPIYNWYRN